MYIQKIVSIHPILSNLECDMVLKYEPDMNSFNKIIFLNKFFFFIHFICYMIETKADKCYTMILDGKEISRNDRSIHSINN
ncbi:hypothetical protein MUK42_26502 [Musa troglodytarum]|uniref:Ycf2 N-terminal domain-containing protein n=1 Tax=Musa troglodytarum TaxID=320322 RepID=A0A9E7EZP1_9LILI|nr:hypothetical protein MUK42_26502 [Musa troglodytarum]